MPQNVMAGSSPRLSGLILWTERMTLILLLSGRFATIWTRKGVNAMRHKNSVYHGILQYVPWAGFEELVEEHEGDKGVRTLTMRDQFSALLYGQLSGAASLREIEGGLESHKARLYHVNAKPVKRATLADANALRPGAVFTGLFSKLMKQAHRGLRRSLEETVYLIDSTSLHLNELSEKWARFSTGVCGAKAHVIYDADAACPVYMAVTAAKVNDITAAKDMPIEAGATYVFDLGYYDYEWWAKLDAAGCRIVTRFKSNTPLCEIEERTVVEGGRSCRIAWDICPPVRRKTVRTPSAIRSVRSVSSSIRAKYCGFCRTISTPAPKKSPLSTGAAGISSSFSAGSNKPSRSKSSSAPRRTLSASRLRSPSSHICCYG